MDNPKDEIGQMSVALDTNPKYSLEPDPTGELKLTTEEKDFISAYIEFKSIPLAAQKIGIDESEGYELYFFAPVKSEIRRINLALYYRQFNRRMLNIDEIGGYLTSLITDTDVPLGERLKPNEKLQAAKLLVNLNEIKSKELDNNTMEYVEIKENVGELDAASIKTLIANVKTAQNTSTEELRNGESNLKKEELIAKMNTEGNFDSAQIAYLKTLPEEELQKYIDQIEQEKEENKEKKKSSNEQTA